MTLFQFISLVKRNYLWILFISFMAASAAFFYIRSQTHRTTLLIKCYPEQKWVSEINQVVINIHDLFEKGNNGNTYTSQVQYFSKKYNIVSVIHLTSTLDSLNTWFKVEFEHEDADYKELTHEFIDIINDILLNHSVLSNKIDGSQELLKPIFPEKPYSDASILKFNPFKGAVIVFLLSFVFVALFFALRDELNKINQ